jgi:putative ABC transport system substrate-binding protein
MKRREFIALFSCAATGCSLPVRAQQHKTAKVGILLLGYPNPTIFLAGLKEGLRDLGYEAGRSIELVLRSAGGRPTALASLAAEMIALQVDVIVAYPTTAGLATKKETSEIPIVVYGGDLETTNLVASLARPGGNVTGVGGATPELAAKNLELIAELLPAARRMMPGVKKVTLASTCQSQCWACRRPLHDPALDLHTALDSKAGNEASSC